MDPYRAAALNSEAPVEGEIRSVPHLGANDETKFEGLRRNDDVLARWAEIEKGLHDPDEPVILSEEGSREVLDEIANGTPLTPERRATFERMRAMAGVRTRKLPPRTPSEQHS